MKIPPQKRLARRVTPSKTLPLRASAAALVAAMLASTGNLQAASATYTGATSPADNNFDTGTNWSTGTAPGDTTGATTNQDVATFALTTGVAVTEATQRNLLGFTFGGTSGTAGTFTIGSTNGAAFLLSSGGTILANAFSNSQTVNAPLVLENAAAATSGTYTVESDTPGTNRLFIFGGAITGTATTGGVTSLTVTGTSAPTSGNQLNGILSDGTGGGKLALLKTGTGLWQISNTGNTFSGGVTVTGGTLRMSSSGNTTATLGTGAVTFNGGTLTLGSTTATTLNNAVVVNASTSSSLIYRGGGGFSPTSMTGTGTLIFNNSNTTTTVITPTTFLNFAGTVDVESASTTANTQLRLASAFTQNSLQNATVIIGTNSSVVQQAGTNSGITTTFGALSGTGTIGGSAAGSGTFVYSIGNNNASTLYSGTVTNGSSLTALTKAGTGTLALTGINTYTGATTVNAGALLINADASVGAVATATAVTLNGGALVGSATFTLDNAGANARPVALTPTTGGALAATTGNTMTVDGVVSGSGPLTIGVANVTSVNGTGVATTVAGNGTVVFTAGNTYSGVTTLSSGTLNINGNFALGGSNYSGLTFAGGTLQYAATIPGTNGSTDISNFSGTARPVTFSTGGGTIDTNGNTVVYATTIGNSGTGGLTKTGAGSLELQAAATYTGNTTVTTGTLLLSTGNVNSSPSVSVGNGGILTLGNTTALSDAGALTLVSGATLNLNGGDATTTETIASLILNGTTEPAGTYSATDLAALSGANGITFNSTGETLTVGGTAVPEPGTCLAGVLLVGAAGWNQRRRVKGLLAGKLA